MIRLDTGGDRERLEALKTRLVESGVRLDPSYKPVLVDPERGHYVVRGWATDEVRAKAETQPNVAFFGDLRVKPMK